MSGFWRFVWFWVFGLEFLGSGIYVFGQRVLRFLGLNIFGFLCVWVFQFGFSFFWFWEFGVCVFRFLGFRVFGFGCLGFQVLGFWFL